MADIKALLNDAGIACAHWLAYLKNNPTYPIPIIVFNAKENFKSYLSKGRKHVRDQQVFKEADVVMKKIMLDQSDAALVEAKTARGVYWRVIAVNLGHQEVGGQFWFEVPGAIAAQCVLCGHQDHKITSCSHYITAKNKTAKKIRKPAKTPPSGPSVSSSQAKSHSAILQEFAEYANEAVERYQSNHDEEQVLWDAGHKAGYNDGFDQGKDEGYVEGHSDGYVVGLEEGRGSLEEFQVGYDVGYQAGHLNAWDEGYKAALREMSVAMDKD